MKKLTKKQMKFITIQLNNPFETDAEICRQADVDQSQVTRWKKDPEFMELYEEILRQQWANAGAKAQAQMEELARNGDRQAIAYVLDHSRFNQPTQLEIKTHVVKVSIDD